MPTATTSDGVEIAYRVAGDGPTAVIFMHGWAGSGAYFDRTIEHLDLMRMRAITFDFRGHGDSGPSDSFGLDELAADVLAVADAAGAETFVLVGYSMSGKFAQYVSCLHPNRVLGQVLAAGTTAGELPLPDELLEGWYGCAGSEERMAELIEPFLTGPVPEGVKLAFARDAAKASRAALVGTMRSVTSTSFADRLDAASVPTLVLGGRLDELFTPDVVQATIFAPLRAARLEFLDCGHEIPMEMPLEFARVIAAFVAELSASPPEGTQVPVAAPPP